MPCWWTFWAGAAAVWGSNRMCWVPTEKWRRKRAVVLNVYKREKTMYRNTSKNSPFKMVSKGQQKIYCYYIHQEYYTKPNIVNYSCTKQQVELPKVRESEILVNIEVRNKPWEIIRKRKSVYFFREKKSRICTSTTIVLLTCCTVYSTLNEQLLIQSSVRLSDI